MALAAGFMIGLAIAGLQSLLDIGGDARQDLERAADWYEQNKRARQ